MFAVIVIEEAKLPGTATILLVVYTTIGLSVIAHGLSAVPLAGRYASWYESHPTDRQPVMESVPAPSLRARGERRSPVAEHGSVPGKQEDRVPISNGPR